MNDYFVINSKMTATADGQMNHDMAKKLWNSFSLDCSNLEFAEGEALSFSVGDCELPVLEQGREYALLVTETGAAVVGKDYGGLMRGFASLIMKMKFDGEVCKIKTVTEQSSYNMKNRMIHICVFPDNTLYEIKKIIRLAGLCQYTHIVIEFWGTLQFDCMKELAWPDYSFTKAEARELVQEVRELGMEPIPMFNQLGHATGSRHIFGKHVVLEQNPRLQTLFTPDGWAWDIHSPKVLQLMKDIRIELYELFGEGEYMHIGCDEAFYYLKNDEERAYLPAYLKELTDEVVKEGRRPMIWMDMLLERNKYPGCAATRCAPDEEEALQGALNPATVMVDWQYRPKEAPVSTLVSLKDNCRDVMGAPWYEPANYKAHVDTIVEYDMFGIMMTTWHVLKEKMGCILGCAKACGSVIFPWSGLLGDETATIMRRISFEGNDYKTSGWSRKEIDT